MNPLVQHAISPLYSSYAPSLVPLAWHLTLCVVAPLTAYVTYEKFEKKMLEVLETQEYAPDTEDVLLQAFRVRLKQTPHL